MNTATKTNQSGQLPEATLDWFKTDAHTEQARMLFTPSVQVALRQHLRLGYWLSKCKPITPETIKRACKAIAFADAPEGAAPAPMEQQHIDAVLCAHQGFTAIVEPGTGELIGWGIPEMGGLLDYANQSYLAGAQARSDRAKKGAEARWHPKTGPAPGPATTGVPSSTVTTSEPEDF